MLTCIANGVSGSSNSFKVEPDNPCQGAISGRIVDNRGDPVWLADVSVYDMQGQQVGSSRLTNDEGKFSFTALDCDRYELRIQLDFVTKEEIYVDVTGDLTQNLSDITLMLHPGTYGTPVILIPGIMGSSSGNKYFPIPRLSHTKPDPNLHIHDPKVPIRYPDGYTGFNHLNSSLNSSGFTGVECPWDWRLKVDEAVEAHLVPAINKALLYSTTGKVHVVAHSMGGLIVRAYIQSPQYLLQDYIDKFAMVGTPNLGSSNPYYIWEGGDPETLDDILVKKFFDDLGPRNFYTETIEKLWKKTYDKKWWTLRTNKKIHDFIRDVAPSLRQLMSTEEFLYSTFYGTTWGLPHPAMKILG